MNKEEELSQEEEFRKKIEFYKGSNEQWFKLYEYLKEHHPEILNEAIDAIQRKK